MRGDGRIFKLGRIWYIAYYNRGREFRETTRSESEAVARKLLRKRLAEITREVFVPPSQERMPVNDLLNILVDDHRINNRKGTKVLEYQMVPLRKYFSLDQVKDLNEVRLENFKKERLAEQKAPATINKELGTLRTALRLAVKRKLISQSLLPNFEMLKVQNARQGFVEKADFDAVVEHLPEQLMDFAVFGYLTGWRKGEIASLRWSDVDIAGGTIRLRDECSKNGYGRLVALEGDLRALIERRLQRRKIPAATGEIRLADLVFHWGAGNPIKDFRFAWKAACEKAGMPGLLFHDLRRSAVRNMVRAGVPEVVAMKISGHRTRSIFDRYNITSEKDIRDAVLKTQAYIESQPAERRVVGMNPGNQPSLKKI
ncbi:MAG: site-specific integrase [Planctomycetes bacterium]|nr:site-specific integrase [Planctomycetota bacterium]